MKKKLTLEQEALVLFYLENHRGKQIKGEHKEIVYEIYRFFKQDRDSSVCNCLNRDTAKKVDGFINTIDWSEKTKSSPKMKQLLPDLYVEPIEEIEEEVSTQPVDMNEVLKGMNAKVVEEEVELKKPTAKRRRKKKD